MDNEDDHVAEEEAILRTMELFILKFIHYVPDIPVILPPTQLYY